MLWVLPPESALALSADEAVAVALERNMQVLASRLEVEASQMAIWAARVWPNPELSWSTSNIVLGRGNDQERDLRPAAFSQLIHNVTLEQSLDLAGRRRAESASAKALAQATSHRAAATLLEVVKSVRLAYVEATRTAASLSLCEKEAELWEQTALLMARRHAVGESAQLEVDKIRLEASDARRRAVDARHNHRTARLALLQWMGHEPADLGLVAELAMPDVSSWIPKSTTEEALLHSAFAQRPDWQAIKAQQLGAQRRALAERRAIWPELKVGLGYSRSHFQISGDNPHSLGFGLGIAVPVLDRRQAGRAEAALALRQVGQAQQALHQEILFAVAEARIAWDHANTKIALLEHDRVLEHAERMRDLALRGFAQGAHSLLEVLEAERTWVTSQHEALTLKQDQHTAAIQLAFETGQSVLGSQS